MDWQEADGDALTLLSNTLRQGEIIAAEIALCKSLMRLKLCSFPSLADRSARAEKTHRGIQGLGNPVSSRKEGH